MSHGLWNDVLIENKKENIIMETYIHCYQCGEDMNRPDWEANACSCIHCDSDISDSSWERRGFTESPLARARHRIDLSDFLNRRPAYVS